MDDVGDVLLAASGPPQVSQPTTPIAHERKKLKKIRALDKCHIARLTNEQRARLLEMRDRKEVGQFLMPDAPPGKKRRFTCMKRTRLFEGGAATPHSPKENQLVFMSYTGIITLDEGQNMDENLFVDASIELVEFSPSTSSSAERSTLQNFAPGPSTSSTRPEPSIYEEDLEEVPTYTLALLL